MAVQIGFGRHLIALALLLCLFTSLNAGEKIDDDERPPPALLPVGAADLQRGTASVADINDEATIENEWPLTRRSLRIRRGVKLPKIKMPSMGGGGTGLPGLNAPSLARAYHTPPKTFPGMPNLERVRPKSFVQGGGGMRKRWKDKESGKIFEWDSQHGELEGYGKNKVHLGSFDPNTGEKIKDAVPGRRLKD